MKVSDKLMGSLDVQSLFTNVPLKHVTSIITDFVETNDIDLGIPSTELANLLTFCTTDVQFIFNGTFYRQIDGIAMGSPLDLFLLIYL